MNVWKENVDSRPAVLLRRTLRSGQSVNYDGNVIVLGDVNPGAEIVASGHVLIMGVLRGFVHAGAAGDEKATVTALFFRPIQIRIASYLTHFSNDDHAFSGETAEIARVRNNELIVEKYQSAYGVIE
jgi:septum site-determining protein MinC